MEMRNVCKRLLSVCFALNLLLPSAAMAAEQEVEADGYYTVGGGPEENVSIAKERAKAEAKIAAAEQVAMFVEKSATVLNHQMTSSDIKTLAAEVMQIKSEEYFPEVLGDVVKYRCHIVAVVDDSQVTDTISNPRELEESLIRGREKDAQIVELNQKLADLKQRYQAASTAEQRAQIQREFKRNEEQFESDQWIEKGIQKVRQKDYEGSIACFQKSIVNNPDSFRAYKYMGDSFFRMKNIKATLECYHKAVQINPKYGPAWNMLGTIAMMAGREKDAVRFFQKGVDANPEIGSAWANLGMASLSSLQGFISDKDFEKIIGYYEKAISLGLKDKGVYHNLGLAYHELGNLKAPFQKTSDTLPEFEKALQCYSVAINLDPNYVNAYNKRGEVYEKLGLYEEAKLDYEKAYELEPNNEQVQKNKRRSESWQ